MGKPYYIGGLTPKEMDVIDAYFYNNRAIINIKQVYRFIEAENEKSGLFMNVIIGFEEKYFTFQRIIGWK